MKADLSKVTKANIDVCTVCNHTCTFCPNQDQRTPKNIMPAEDFHKVLTDLTAHISPRELGLSAKGEPLLNPQLGDIISIAKQQFNIPYVYISTNGSLLNESILKSLLDLGLDSIKFSINAFDRESYKDIHGKDHFDRVMNNLTNAIDMSATHNFKLLISSVTGLESHEIREAFRKQIGDKIDKIKYIIRYKEEFRPHIETEIKAGLDYSHCPYLGKEVYIDPTCQLAPCCNDYFGQLNFGSLLETPLEELWNSNKFIALKTMIEEKKLPHTHLCYRCLTNDQDMCENDKHAVETLQDKRSKTE